MRTIVPVKQINDNYDSCSVCILYLGFDARRPLEGKEVSVTKE